LSDAGAEVVKGDMDDTGSLHDALKGCYGVFGVTSFWEHFDKELQQGTNLLEAVAAAGIHHFIFSSLPGAKKISNGALVVPHFDIKAQLEDDARSRGLKATFVHVAFYYENFLSFFPPTPDESGTLAFGLPQGDTKLAGVCVDDLGGVVSPIFNDPDNYIGKTVGVVGDDLPPQEYANIMTKVLGKTVKYNYIPKDVFASFGFPGADDLATMFEFNRTLIPNRQADLDESHSVYPQIQNFET
jgi:uncharacterized protein YbjT (DUF2867 family)